MAYNILASEGNNEQKRAINAVNALHGDKFKPKATEIYQATRAYQVKIRWLFPGYLSVTPGNTGIYDSQGKLAGVASESSTLTISSAHTGTELQKIIQEALLTFGAKYGISGVIVDPNKPLPPPLPPTDEPVAPAPETIIYFTEEDTNLFHKESHTGLNPAEFFANRDDVIAKGYTPDAGCGA